MTCCLFKLQFTKTDNQGSPLNSPRGSLKQGEILRISPSIVLQTCFIKERVLLENVQESFFSFFKIRPLIHLQISTSWMRRGEERGQGRRILGRWLVASWRKNKTVGMTAKSRSECEPHHITANKSFCKLSGPDHVHGDPSKPWFSFPRTVMPDRTVWQACLPFA